VPAGLIHEQDGVGAIDEAIARKPKGHYFFIDREPNREGGHLSPRRRDAEAAAGRTSQHVA
jgi:hypothetical protein